MKFRIPDYKSRQWGAVLNETLQYIARRQEGAFNAIEQVSGRIGSSTSEIISYVEARLAYYTSLELLYDEVDSRVGETYRLLTQRIDTIELIEGPEGQRGPQGTEGLQGLQGPRGFQGERGYAGEVGERGETGLQGPEGSPGVRGPIGPQGISGPIGPEGLQGPRGPQGVQGVEGEKGDRGPKGDIGETGLRGPQGDQGIRGPEGPQGQIGPKGVQGESGIDGDDGPMGPEGPMGPKGDRGPKGNPGSSISVKGSLDSLETLHGMVGTDGEGWLVEGHLWVWSSETSDWVDTGNIQGPAGPQGIEGPVGPKGDTGARGAQGEQGIRGEIGPVGPEGVAGPEGPQGEQGPQGVQGDVGPQGERGLVGPKGDEGIQGEDGIQGPQGIQGEIGPEGPQGEKGDLGESGPQGTQGIKGDTGARGQQGIQGPSGPDGPQGIRGPQGLKGDPGSRGPIGPTGPQGLQGPRGIQGEKGSPADIPLATPSQDGRMSKEDKSLLNSATTSVVSNSIPVRDGNGVVRSSQFLAQGDPTANLHTATKQYVDSEINRLTPGSVAVETDWNAVGSRSRAAVVKGFPKGAPAGAPLREANSDGVFLGPDSYFVVEPTWAFNHEVLGLGYARQRAELLDCDPSYMRGFAWERHYHPGEDKWTDWTCVGGDTGVILSNASSGGGTRNRNWVVAHQVTRLYHSGRFFNIQRIAGTVYMSGTAAPGNSTGVSQVTTNDGTSIGYFRTGPEWPIKKIWTPDALEINGRIGLTDAVQQGSSKNRWYSRLTASDSSTVNEHLRACRYGPGNAGTTAWLPFTLSWQAPTISTWRGGFTAGAATHVIP